MSTLNTKIKSPRNKTIAVSAAEAQILMAQTKTLLSSSSVSDIENRIIHQDVFQCSNFLPDSFIDLLIIDPPYNLSKVYSKTKFTKTSSVNYEQWLDSWLSKITRCLKPTASIYVCCDWQSSISVYTIFQKYFFIRNRIVWEREKGRGSNINWKNCSEDIWFCTKSKDYFFDVNAVKLKRKVIAPYRDKLGSPKDWQKSELGNFRMTCPSNIWTDISIPFWSMPENTTHSTQKPEKLIAKLILASSRPGDFVFDPFLGSGTTCVVAKKLDRRYSGIELEEEYCQFAVKRLMQAEQNKNIQGYHDGCFWERNSLSVQK